MPRTRNTTSTRAPLRKSRAQAGVAKGPGIAESTISEVLAGRRKLNRAQIGKLAHYFRVGPETFAFGEP
jgi:HTH-type transcriptional regulator / antitoxin HigA